MNIILFLVQYFGFLTLIPLLARLIILSILLILSKKLVSIREIREICGLNFVPFVSFVAKLPKMKTKPKQSHSKPFFQRSNPILSLKMGIFDNFRTTFLCKTKPFFSKIQIENKGLTAVSKSKCCGMQDSPGLFSG